MLLNVVISGCISMFMMGRTNRNLELRANMDETTRLPNRKYFRYIFDKRIKRGKRKVHSLAMVDVDNFKTYNDTHGHLYGNTILTFVAKSMKEAFDHKGVVARWGGDEFILLSYMSPAMTKAMIDDLNEYLKKQNRLESISLSVGITIIDPKHSLEELMENADKALYAAKTAGKGCSMIY
jgi:diguanylate cyclase (GGDEF)-like protein